MDITGRTVYIIKSRMLLMGGEREFAAGNKNSEVNLISHVIATIPFLWMWGGWPGRRARLVREREGEMTYGDITVDFIISKPGGYII